ncbi:SO_0444 family Cu/Zn efflux transporter [Larsenimonas rhizosphaerae]|uniref:SO_0444 family Cu/Zn efflux transporter n=1 Tax=Larsenimonas rhizosphaerae TaxID=2944682 RepID=A0AA42CWY1_9GAMM|nr:SO_0444 family Cu/Zn efflux transporter [Larsenimonas rhizosphaerae]MCX2523208.1 SO_0444 family Cu/Zn efflux transporter [Larsenimonas rhizosphaerae]
MNMMTDILNAFLELWQEAAFWLLLGLVVAGLLKTFVKSAHLGGQLQGNGPWPAIKAAVIGIPLPLCSCGVIPAAIGLKRAGASNSATTAFLISTPETGADSIAVSWALLGPFMTIIRPVAATCSALAAAMLVLFSDRRRSAPLPAADDVSKTSCSTRCCGHSRLADSMAATQPPSLARRLWDGQRYAFTEVLGDLSLWLIAGLIASALIVALVPHDALAEVTQGPSAMIIMALVGVPMYICASASTPLAAGLMLAGVSPGAVLVFLLAGPATNMATLGIVHREMGPRALAAYLVGVIGVAIGFGYATNALVALGHVDIQGELTGAGQLVPTAISVTASVLLAVAIVSDLWQRLVHRWQGRSAHEHAHHGHRSD